MLVIGLLPVDVLDAFMHCRFFGFFRQATQCVQQVNASMRQCVKQVNASMRQAGRSPTYRNKLTLQHQYDGNG
jgi:hypothetical protein